MAQIHLDDLPEIRKRHSDKKIVLVTGGFDLTHAGHVLFFEEAKRQGDILVVMIGADAVTKHIKGEKRPILNEHLRWKMVDSLKPVDYTFLDHIISTDTRPLYFIDMVIGKLKPDAYVINEDAFDIPYRREFMKKYPDTKLIILPRHCPPEFENVSTTSLIEKIKATLN